jgi:hypothetical protein
MRVLIMLFVALNMVSCYSSYTTSKFLGNTYQSGVGKSKNEILRTYGVPDRSSEDGAGGEVLIYEKITQTTVSNSNSQSYGASKAAGAAGYNKYGTAVGVGESRSASTTNGNSITQTSNEKTFVNYFVNKDGIVYDYKANCGDNYEYSKNRCFMPGFTWLLIASSAAYPPLLIATVPVGVLLHVRAKKRNMICGKKKLEVVW